MTRRAGDPWSSRQIRGGHALCTSHDSSQPVDDLFAELTVSIVVETFFHWCLGAFQCLVSLANQVDGDSIEEILLRVSTFLRDKPVVGRLKRQGRDDCVPSSRRAGLVRMSLFEFSSTDYAQSVQLRYHPRSDW